MRPPISGNPHLLAETLSQGHICSPSEGRQSQKRPRRHGRLHQTSYDTLKGSPDDIVSSNSKPRFSTLPAHTSRRSCQGNEFFPGVVSPSDMFLPSNDIKHPPTLNDSVCPPTYMYMYTCRCTYLDIASLSEDLIGWLGGCVMLV